MQHQVELIEEYRTGSAPRVVVLDAPVGSGKSVTLAAIAADRAAHGDLVLMVMPRLMVPQARELVANFGEVSPTVYSAPSDFRLALGEEASPWPESGVVICSTSVISSPVAMKALPRVVPSLLMVDDVWVSRNSDLARSLAILSEQSAKVLVTGREEQYWFLSAAIRRWTFPLVDSQGRLVTPEFSVRVHEYRGDPVERELVRQAVELLGRSPFLTSSQSSTRIAIQSSLLRLVQRLQDPDRLPTSYREERAKLSRQDEVDRQMVIDSMWRVLDAFDDLPQDGRLLAVVEEISTAFDALRPVLIVTGLVKEADYIAAAAQEYGLSVSTITMSTRREARVSALADMQAGGALIATAQVLTEAQRPLPDRTRSLWFAPPASRRQTQQRLGIGISSRDIEIVLFKAVPPVTPADESLGRLEEILRDLWQEFNRI
jgi:superfamily II DNA or RNA helicase